MADLSLSSIELTSFVNKAPANGIRSSSEYNTFQVQLLNDLAEIIGFLNEQLMPLLNALPSAAAEGLDGSTLYAKRDVSQALFADSDGQYYTVSEVLSALSNTQTSLARKLDELAARVTALMTRLATTDNNDLRASLQAMQDSYRTMASTVSLLAANASSALSLASKTRGVLLDLEAKATGSYDVSVVFAPAFSDTNYAVTAQVEGTNGISVNKVVKNGSTGVTVTVVYDGTTPSGRLSVVAQAL